MAEGDNAQNWESDAEERVWYVAYGSNIDKERFKEHIKTEIMPESRAYELPFDLYFAAKAPKRKNGGVAFVATERGTEKTLGRMYLLTLRQFTQVAKGKITT